MTATVVEFRTGVDDKVGYAARWLRKAVALGARARVVGADETLEALDRVLWVEHPQDFVPHAWARAAAMAPGLGRTPIWLGEGEVPTPGPALLLNLGAEFPDGAEAYERIVEIVGTGETDAADGRRRWRQYQQRGFAPRHRGADATG